MTDKQTLAQSLRRYGSDFISHAASRGIEDIEAAGELMLEAARALAEQADDARCRELLEAFDDVPEPAEQEPVALPSAVRKAAYDQIDRFIRNNLHDDDYADYSAALDSLYTAPQPKPSGPDTMTVQEVWEASGGNPGIRATKQGVLDALKMLDAVCDEARPAEQCSECNGMGIQDGKGDKCPLCDGCGEQPAEQEPRPCHVFNVTKNGSLTEWEPTTMAFALPDGKHALYTAPQPAKREPLTREELADAWLSVEHIAHAAERQIAFARAIITAYERKNGIGGQS